MDFIPYPLVVHNNSQDSIYVYAGIGAYYYSPNVYPDTLLPKEMALTTGRMLSETFSPIPGKSYRETKYAVSHDGEDIDAFFRDYIPRDTICIFFIKPDTLKKYGYDDVQANNRISYRYDLSSSDIKKLSYKIPYPPSESMRGMKTVRFDR